LEEPKLRQERFTAENVFEDKEDAFKEAKTNYRHAMDMRVQNTDDIQQQTSALKQYKIAARELQAAENEYNFIIKYYDEKRQEFMSLKNDAVILEDNLIDLLKDLTIAKVANNLSHRDYQFITVSLSDTCLTMIENGFDTKCPTYRTLYHTFDTSIPVISGEMEDLGYDLKRASPKYEKHWKYYEQMKYWKVIIVDPDHKIKNRSINIVIQPNTFQYLENIR